MIDREKQIEELEDNRMVSHVVRGEGLVHLELFVYDDDIEKLLEILRESIFLHSENE